jgi:hypothetical protein
MAQSNEHLDALVRELAELNPAEQAQVVARAAQLRKTKAKVSRLVIPVLRGGTQWLGGDLSRETIYNDDGR